MDRDEFGRLAGLIPAHAGKTWTHASSSERYWAHPRSRGENVLEEIGGDVEKGSSPLTRGKRRTRDWDSVCAGLIPAHAGKTVNCGVGCGAVEAHPRSRGENAIVTLE